MSGDLYFIDIAIRLRKPRQLLTNKYGKLPMTTLRSAEVSLPIKDVDRARQLMDQLAKSLTEVFQEIEATSPKRAVITDVDHNRDDA